MDGTSYLCTPGNITYVFDELGVSKHQEVIEGVVYFGVGALGSIDQPVHLLLQIARFRDQSLRKLL